MTLTYDFDMFSIIPDEVQKQFQGKFNELGLSAMMSQQMAMFRDPATVQALYDADEVVKEYFRASGFGLQVYDSGAPTGRYPAYDEAARNRCVQSLTDNLPAFDLKDANWGGFDLAGFLTYLATVQPMDEIEINALNASRQNTMATRPKGRKSSVMSWITLLSGVALVMWAGISALSI